MSMFRLGPLLGHPRRTQRHHPRRPAYRHTAPRRCDWGELCEDDRAANDTALLDGSRVLSVYTINGERIWVITEAEPRRATTVLRPEDY